MTRGSVTPESDELIEFLEGKAAARYPHDSGHRSAYLVGLLESAVRGMEITGTSPGEYLHRYWIGDAES